MATINLNTADMNKQIAQLKAKFEAKSANVGKATVTAVTNSCLAVEAEAKKLMQNATVDTSITYGKRGHHPSVPGSAPASDSGDMIKSISHDVVVTNSNVVGRTGSTMKNPPYPAYLEDGATYKDGHVLLPRPWMNPALNNKMDYIHSQFKAVPSA